MTNAWTFPTDEPLFIAVSAQGSMNRRVDRKPRPTRLDMATDACAKLLRSLPADMRVQLIAYGAHLRVISARDALAALTSLGMLTAADVLGNAGHVLDHCLTHLIVGTVVGQPIKRGNLLLCTDGVPSDMLRWTAYAQQNVTRSSPLHISVLKLADFDGACYVNDSPRFRMADARDVEWPTPRSRPAPAPMVTLALGELLDTEPPPPALRMIDEAGPITAEQVEALAPPVTTADTPAIAPPPKASARRASRTIGKGKP